MLAGLGVDLCDSRRIRATLERHGARFAARILHPEERAAHARARDPARDLAKRWAAKEAASKALGTGYRGVAPREIALLQRRSGEPYLVLSGRAEQVLARRGGGRVLVSLSDEGPMVMAVAAIETAS